MSNNEPSFSDLVYDVLQNAPGPLTFVEIFDQVNRLRPVNTKNPTSTIRNALSQGSQLVSTGDGRYGYLPHLIKGSLLRIPLIQKDPQNEPVIYTDEVRHALWPSFMESQKRSRREPVQVRLAGGRNVAFDLDFFGQGVWGERTQAELRLFLIENAAKTGDSLLVKVIDAEAGLYEANFEARGDRDEKAVMARNRELADAACQYMRKSRTPDVLIWDMIVSLLGRGIYRANVAPDPLEEVLRADSRFVYGGISCWTLSEIMTPEIQAMIDRRLMLDPEIMMPELKQNAGSETTPPNSASRRPMEQTLADVKAIISETDFASIDDLNMALEQMLAAGGVPHRRVATPLDRAQEIIYDAWETGSRRERVKMAHRALQISPDCADAYNILAEDMAASPQEEFELYAAGVAAGERALGRKAFKNWKGEFWGVIETRPYMRARCGMALTLWTLGRQEEAIAQVWDMLSLNPGDNQGMRYALLNWLLETADHIQLGKLMKSYKGEFMAQWLYGHALFAFQTGGDTEEARKWLVEAINANKYVPAYLLKRKRLPKFLPDTIGFGDVDEAVACADGLMAAWEKTPGALDWLARNAKPETKK